MLNNKLKLKPLYLFIAGTLILAGFLLIAGSKINIEKVISWLDKSAQAQTNCHLFTSAGTAPAGFGAWWDVFTNKLLIRATCSSSSAIINVGDGDNHYIYEKGYRWNGASWQPINFEGGSKVGAWYKNSASATINLTPPELENNNYVVAYVCTWKTNQWKCGCQDSGCANRYWQLQKFKKAAATYQCSDSTDNDGDELMDYPNDPGCSSTTDNDEYNAPADTAFSINDRVITTDVINVRSTPSTSGTLSGVQPTNSLGTITEGPTYADGYWWWKIDYDNAPDGWSAENWLEKQNIKNLVDVVSAYRLRDSCYNVYQNSDKSYSKFSYFKIKDKNGGITGVSGKEVWLEVYDTLNSSNPSDLKENFGWSLFANDENGITIYSSYLGGDNFTILESGGRLGVKTTEKQFLEAGYSYTFEYDIKKYKYNKENFNSRDFDIERIKGEYLGKENKKQRTEYRGVENGNYKFVTSYNLEDESDSSKWIEIGFFNDKFGLVAGEMRNVQGDLISKAQQIANGCAASPSASALPNFGTMTGFNYLPNLLEVYPPISDIAKNSLSDMQIHLDLLKEAGVKWIRDGIPWMQTEPNKGDSYNFGAADNLVREAGTRNITVLFTIDWPTKWAQRTDISAADFGPNDPRTRLPKKEYVMDFQNFVKASVERYDGDGYQDISGLSKPIKYWSFDNEMEIENPNEYAWWMKRFYETVKCKIS